MKDMRLPGFAKPGNRLAPSPGPWNGRNRRSGASCGATPMRMGATGRRQPSAAIWPAGRRRACWTAWSICGASWSSAWPRTGRPSRSPVGSGAAPSGCGRSARDHRRLDPWPLPAPGAALAPAVAQEGQAWLPAGQGAQDPDPPAPLHPHSADQTRRSEFRFADQSQCPSPGPVAREPE